MNTLETIPQFYANKDIFITGATGFIGKVLVEKLLRSCPDINRIFILMRNKRGASIQNRMKEFTESELFHKVMSTNPTVMNKIVPVLGDVKLIGLGLSIIDKKLLENVSIIFHSAASVRFDDGLKDAIIMNARGTREMLYFALTLKKFEVFLYISTTYCNADHAVIEEKIYPEHTDWKRAISIAENVDGSILDILCKKYTDYMANTYIFTKGLAEHICDDYKSKIPIVIFRPAIVIGIEKEPLPGWAANFNGPVGLMVGAGAGLLRGFYCDKSCALFCTPADVCVKAVIVAAWKKAQSNDKKTIPVYNSATGKTTIDEMTGTMVLNQYKKFPISNALWAPGGIKTQNRLYFRLLAFFVHFLPALLIDTILTTTGRKPILLKIQRKIQSAILALEHFVTKHFTMVCDNYIKLVEYILPEDWHDFSFAVVNENIDRYNYAADLLYASRIYILKDPIETLPHARKRLIVLTGLDYALKMLLIFVAFYLIQKSNVHNLLYEYFYK